jgi:uncharacterized protein
MKYLLLLPLVLLALWLILRQRGSHRDQGKDPAHHKPAAAAPTPAPSPTEIIECARCTVHLPRTDAVAGLHGLHYCCTAHRQDAEGG